MMFFPVPINDCYSCGQKYIASTCPHCEITRLRAQIAAEKADKLAAIAKAVNEKLEEVAKAVADQAQRSNEANTPISAYALRYARDTILTMKEPE